MQNLGIYIHIPFCTSKCSYCDFYSLTGELSQVSHYTAAVCRALKEYKTPGPVVDTIYFGGGTPSVLELELIAEIMRCLRENYNVLPSAEITIEVNPGTVDKQKFGQYLKMGINRLSVGVQSTNSATLQLLGRTHTPQVALEAIKTAKKCGFANISADLIIGVHGQTNDEIKKSIADLADAGATHISAYILKIEEGTRLKTIYPGENPAEENIPQQYLYTCKMLEQAGYKQYEISNFAKDELYSRHNLKYWNCEHYLGIGPSAHSFMGGRRFSFGRSLKDFMALQSFKPAEITEETTAGDLTEYVAMRMRLTNGLVYADAAERYSTLKEKAELESIKTAAAHLAAKHPNLVLADEHRVHYTTEGMLFENHLTAALLFDD